MSSETRYEFQAGIFLLITLALFGLSVFLLGRDRQIFESQAEFTTSFEDIKGLNEGAPVRLGGITIGRVAGIRFSDDPNDFSVSVSLLINERHLPRLRADSLSSIDTQGLLGDRYVAILGGASSDLLPPGSIIPSRQSSDLGQALSRAGSVVDSTADIAERISSLVTKLDGKPMEDLTQVLSAASSIAAEVESGKGLLHRLVYSKKDGDSVLGSLEQTSKDLAAIVAQAKNGNGLLNALIFGENGAETTQALITALGDLSRASTEIATVAEHVRTGDGLAHELIFAKSPEGVDSIVASLARTAANLEQVSRALSEGSGTLGALLVDAKLYDNVVEITDDAKRSYILRRAIRKSLETAQKDPDETTSRDSTPTDIGTVSIGGPQAPLSPSP